MADKTTKKCYMVASKLRNLNNLKEKTGFSLKLTKILFPHKLWWKKEESFDVPSWKQNKKVYRVQCMCISCVCKKGAYFISVMPSSTVYKWKQRDCKNVDKKKKNEYKMSTKCLQKEKTELQKCPKRKKSDCKNVYKKKNDCKNVFYKKKGLEKCIQKEKKDCKNLKVYKCEKKVLFSVKC